MARQTRSTDDPPKRTPSFVCEVPLRVRPAQERTLLARLEAARQVYNACLGEARKRVRLVRESKAFQHARTLYRDDPVRKARFREARTQHAFSEYGLHAYAPRGLLMRMWIGLSADTILYGRRVLPQRGLDLGYQFQFPTLESALHDLVDTEPSNKK